MITFADNADMQKAREKLAQGELPSKEIVLNIIRKKIIEFLAENDRILQIQEKLRNFDFLLHWMANDGVKLQWQLYGKMKLTKYNYNFLDPKVTFLAAKEKPKKGAGGKPKAEKKMKPGAKTKSQELIESKLVRVPAPIYLVKDMSPLAIRGQSPFNQV